MTSDLWQRERTRALLQDPAWVRKSEKFREHIFETHRFTPAAREFIHANSRIIVLDFASEQGGGGYWPPGSFDSNPAGLVQLFTAQHEGAVHELSHVWWHFWRLHHPGLKKDLVRNVVTLAELSPEKNPEWAEAINLAHIYVHGNERGNEIWIGMLGDADGRNNPANLPRNIHNLTEEDFEKRVNDWEIFAGLASFTMGWFNSGARKLPPSMYIYFEPLFMGALNGVGTQNDAEVSTTLNNAEPAAPEETVPEEASATFAPAAFDADVESATTEPPSSTETPPSDPVPAPDPAPENEEPAGTRPRAEPPPPAVPPTQERPVPSAPKKDAPGKVSGAATSGHNCMLATVLSSLLRR